MFWAKLSVTSESPREAVGLERTPGFRENCHGSLKTGDTNELCISGEAVLGLQLVPAIVALYEPSPNQALQLPGL